MKLNRNLLLQVLLCAAVVAAPAARATAQGGSTKLSLTMGGAPIVPYTSSLIAIDKNYFAEAGLDVKRKTIFAVDVARVALTSGDIDVAAMAVDSLIRGHLAGFDWKILYPAVLYDPQRPDAQVVARSELSVGSPKDLEGKTVAMTLGTMGEPAFKAWLRSKGGDWTKVKIVEVAFPQMLPALQSKRIDAAYMVEPGLTQALDAGIAKIVGANLDIVGGRFLIAAYVARESWIKSNPEKARRFVEGIARATRFGLDHPDEALPMVVKQTKLDRTLVAKFFPAHWVAATEISGSEIQRVIDFLVREKFIDRTFSYRDIVSSHVPLRP
jgi:NitT/TauT family transport system substrate-binding protein